ncbi:hypothetical protein AGMMS50293_10500 [Spirochaetia bacterium]|nr:hypothetical protein AGMMS50293_10500 [Spirochaetia bacterium]
MKRGVIAIILILGAVFAFAQNSGPIDLILLLDTSSSMSASYDTVNSYMTGGFLKEFLRIGDTFHLIPFSDKPRVDISRRVEGSGDLETIIGRMLLQYPLDSWSDIPAALSFAESYAASLPSRSKKIVLISDGDSAPAPGSSSRALDAAGLTTLINDTKTRLGSRGISLEFVKITAGQPIANPPSSGRAPASRPAQSTPAAGTRPAQTTPPPAASTAPSQPAQQAAPGVAAPPASTSPAPAAPGVTTPSVVTTPPSTATSGGSAAPSAPATPGTTAPVVTTPPSTTTPGGSAAPSFPAAPGTADPSAPNASSPIDISAPAGIDEPQSPESSSQPAARQPASPTPSQPAAQQPASPTPSQPTVPAQPREAWQGLDLPLPLLIGLAIAGLAILILIIFLVARRLQASPNRAMAMAASPTAVREAEPSEPFVDHSKDLANYAASQPRQRTTPYSNSGKLAPVVIDPNGPLLLNLFVEDQNTFIGKRNIHALKSGYKFTIGGGKSDFLVFLVPIPPSIGEIRRDGGRCTFIPRKPKYFPDIGSQEVTDCIGKTIRIVSDKNYELRFRFERYEDPLVALNRMLNSVKVPG